MYCTVNNACVIPGNSANGGSGTGGNANNGSLRNLPNIPSPLIQTNNTSTNNPPIADSGSSVDVDEEYIVLLNGSKSSDPDGHPITFSWRQIVGPGVILDDPTNEMSSFRAPKVLKDTKLLFELIVKDDKGLKGSSIVTITDNPVTTANTTSSTLSNENANNLVKTTPLKETNNKVANNYLFTKSWGTFGFGFGSGNGQFHYPQGVDVDSSGNVYVADWGNNRIQKFSYNR